MKKIIICLILVFILLSGCSQNSDSATSENSANRVAIAKEKVYLTQYDLGGYSYYVPSNWFFDDTINENQYFYPDCGMLMTSLLDEYLDFTDKEIQIDFIEGLKEGYDEFELISSKIQNTQNGTPIYVINARVSIETHKNISSEIVIFWSDKESICFWMGTFEDSTEDYSEDFETIINSVKYVGIEETQAPTSEPSPTQEIEITAEPTPTPTLTSAPTAEPTPEVPLEYRNALSSARDYLNVMSFSYSGLIEQLEYEEYSTEAATYAADNCGADWNEQAAKSAQEYLDYSSFSRQGLIDQLIYEGFTPEQAEYGVTSVGY